MVASVVLILLTFGDEVEDEAGTEEEGERVDEFVDHGVGDVRVSRPDVSLGEDRSHVGPPGVPRPSKNLLDEPPVRLHRRQKLGLLAALDIGVPSVGDHPSSKELVVSGVEVVLSEPKIVGESVEELGILEDDRSVGRCSS